MLDLINLIKNGPPKRPSVARAREGKPADPPNRSAVARARERKPRGTWRPWTDEDISTLREMAGKHSTEEIAKALNRTVQAVGQRAHKLCISLSLRGFDPSIIDAARVLQEAGFTAQQIIDMFEIGSEKAKRIRRALEDRK